MKENVFPPSTGVDPIPKLQGPAAETLDWYSFRQTLKNVSQSLLEHFRSAVFRAPSQHEPLCNSPLALCIDKICNSNCPDPTDTFVRKHSKKAATTEPRLQTIPAPVCCRLPHGCWILQSSGRHTAPLLPSDLNMHDWERGTTWLGQAERTSPGHKTRQQPPRPM